MVFQHARITEGKVYPLDLTIVSALLISLMNRSAFVKLKMFPYTKEFIQSGAAYPETPAKWPEYDSEQFFQRLKMTDSIPQIEIALSFKNINLKCTFDPSSHFQEPLKCEHMLDDERQGILVQALDLIVLILYDEDGLMRVSCGVRSWQLLFSLNCSVCIYYFCLILYSLVYRRQTFR